MLRALGQREQLRADLASLTAELDVDGRSMYGSKWSSRFVRSG